MSYEKFRDEVKKLAGVKDLTLETNLEHLDSMAKTEICMLAEEELNVELEYGDVHKACKAGPYKHLQDLIAEKGYGPY